METSPSVAAAPLATILQDILKIAAAGIPFPDWKDPVAVAAWLAKVWQPILDLIKDLMQKQQKISAAAMAPNYILALLQSEAQRVGGADWRNILQAAVRIYNIIAGAFGWPLIPVPEA